MAQRSTNWVVINLASLIPAAAALTVVAVALQTMFVAHGDCNAGNSQAELRTNPVLCADKEIMHRLLDQTVTTAQLMDANLAEDPAAARINLGGERAPLKKDYDDANAEKTEAEAEITGASAELNAAQAVLKDAQDAVTKAGQKPMQAAPSRPASRPHRQGAPGQAHAGRGAGGSRLTTAPSPPAPADTTTVDKAKVDAAKSVAEAAKGLEAARKNATEAGNKSVAARQKLASFDNAVGMAVKASLLREARARLLWFGSFGVSLVVALATIFAMGWVWVVAIGDHWLPTDLTPDIRYQLKMTAVIAASLATLCFIGVVAYVAIDYGLFDWKVPRSAILDGLSAFDDSLQSYVFGSDKTVKPAVLLDRGLPLLKEGNWAVIGAVILISAAVTAILYQHPEQVRARVRKEGSPAARLLATLRRSLKHKSSTVDNDAYNAFLQTLRQHPEQVVKDKRPANELLETLSECMEPVGTEATAADNSYNGFLNTLRQRLNDLGTTAPRADQLLATLYRNPNWGQVRTAATAADKAYNRFLATLHQSLKQITAAADDPYIRFLARCFQRLSVAIYFGAVLLVVSVGRISAQYGWPAALLDPEATEQPIKTHLVEALKNVADQFAVEYGMIFTLLLLSLFLPAWFVLRRRAWETARARKPGATQDCQQKWLSSQGLAFTYPQHAAQLVALLAPAGAGIFLDALKSFTGG